MTTPEHKTFDRAAYMRAYKAKQYADHPENIRTAHRCYYAKYKYGLDADDMKRFGNLVPECARAISLLNQIQETRPDLVRHILDYYA